ncbi:hypothetical protein EU534_02335, partial [Candidatus Heimdallarchaeota archaeon]
MNSSENTDLPEWRKTQLNIAKILRNNSFETWEERALDNRRIDLLAKRYCNNKIYNIVFEFKHYENVTASSEDKFLEQLHEYLQLLI